DQDVVELKQLLAVRPLAQLRIDLRKIEPIFSGTRFVKKFTETVNVGLRRAWTFRRNIALGADERLLSARCDQSDVRQLRNAFRENDVGWFDVAMGQSMLVQCFERFR